MSRRITEQRSFGPNLEWESLPVLGAPENYASRHAFRARVWRMMLLALAIFWCVVIWAAQSL